MELQSSLERDNHRILELAQLLEDTSNREPDRRSELLYELRVEVEAHNRVEERVLFPLMLQDKAAHDAVIRAREENHAHELLLEELKNMHNTDPDFDHKLRLLSQGLRTHADFEREALHARLSSFIGDGQEDLLAERMQDERERAVNEVHDRS